MSIQTQRGKLFPLLYLKETEESDYNFVGTGERSSARKGIDDLLDWSAHGIQHEEENQQVEIEKNIDVRWRVRRVRTREREKEIARTLREMRELDKLMIKTGRKSDSSFSGISKPEQSEDKSNAPYHYNFIMNNLTKKVDNHLFKRRELNWAMQNSMKEFKWKKDKIKHFQKTEFDEDSTDKAEAEIKTAREKEFIKNLTSTAYKEKSSFRSIRSFREYGNKLSLKNLNLNRVFIKDYEIKQNEYRVNLPPGVTELHQHMNEYYSHPPPPINLAKSIQSTSSILSSRIGSSIRRGSNVSSSTSKVKPSSKRDKEPISSISNSSPENPRVPKKKDPGSKSRRLSKYQPPRSISRLQSPPFMIDPFSPKAVLSTAPYRSYWMLCIEQILVQKSSLKVGRIGYYAIAIEDRAPAETTFGTMLAKVEDDLQQQKIYPEHQLNYVNK